MCLLYYQNLSGLLVYLLIAGVYYYDYSAPTFQVLVFRLLTFLVCEFLDSFDHALLATVNKETTPELSNLKNNREFQIYAVFVMIMYMHVMIHKTENFVIKMGLLLISRPRAGNCD